MTSIEEQEAAAIEFVRSIGRGNIGTFPLADDFSAWSVNSGMNDKQIYLGKLTMIHEIFKSPMVMTIDTVTSQPGRVAIQARSRGELLNGAVYANTYMFLIEFNDAGYIRHVREYYDQRPAAAVLGPARQEWMARNSSRAAT